MTDDHPERRAPGPPHKELLAAAAPRKPWKDMTDEELDALADALFEKMQRGLSSRKGARR